MFVTDSFLNAEVAYRESRVRREWDRRGKRAAVRRNADGSLEGGAIREA